MKKNMISIFTGDGHGKTPAALGRALQAASRGEEVIIIQFLKGKGLEESAFIRRMEPEIKLFRFEKSDVDFELLSEEQKKDEVLNIRNGLLFARKVMSTNACDMLILDEVLGLIDTNIVSQEEFKEVLACKPDEMELILTGITLKDDICVLADEVSRIETVRFKKWDDIG